MYASITVLYGNIYDLAIWGIAFSRLCVVSRTIHFVGVPRSVKLHECFKSMGFSQWNQK